MLVLLVLLLVTLVAVAARSVYDGDTWLSHGVAGWLLHAWLHHHWLLHAGLHHHWLLHAGLHHHWLLHAGLHHRLLHTWLHHHRLLHAGLHHWLLHTWLHHRLLHTGLHHWLHAWLHHRLLHAGLHHWLHAGLHHWLHTWLHHWLHASSGSTRLSGTSLSGLPHTLQVNLARRFATVSNLEPLIDTLSDTEGGQLEGGLTNLVIRAGILVEHFDVNIVTDVLDINVEGLVPDGGLTCTILHERLEVLLTGRDLTVRVHLTECLGVTG